jgi:hypothetical protein
MASFFFFNIFNFIKKKKKTLILTTALLIAVMCNEQGKFLPVTGHKKGTGTCVHY